MTVIECFEKNPIENIISALYTSPKKLIFLGDVALMQSHTERYAALLKQKAKDCKIELYSVDKSNLQDIVRAVCDIVSSNDDCLFDITGGEDLVLLGVGIAYEKLKDTKPFRLHRFNIPDGVVLDCLSSKRQPFCDRIELSVKELIWLYGGIVSPENPQPSSNISLSDINALWNINIKSPSDYNKFISILHEFERKCSFFADDIDICLNLSVLRSACNDFSVKFSFFKNYLKRLSGTGIMRNVYFGVESVKYSYKNKHIKPIFLKSGNILEYKCFFAAKNIKQGRNEYFSDAYLNVVIDWDGIVHPIFSEQKDTVNEIDIILMRSALPIFISCKNGKIEEAELYKLNTVAERFGSKYAKKVLIATDLSSAEPIKADSIKQRAKDMGITLIHKAADFSNADWEKLFRNLG